jgi:hypothetical protein
MYRGLLGSFITVGRGVFGLDYWCLLVRSSALGIAVLDTGLGL